MLPVTPLASGSGSPAAARIIQLLRDAPLVDEHNDLLMQSGAGYAVRRDDSGKRIDVSLAGRSGAGEERLELEGAGDGGLPRYLARTKSIARIARTTSHALVRHRYQRLARGTLSLCR